MGLDYTAGCVNFRDVGEFLTLLSGESWLPPGRLLRGGRLDVVESALDIGSPGTVINLRAGPDRLGFPTHVVHRPAENSLEKYDTSDKRVRRWLREVIGVFEDETLPYPVLIHCTSGKDRTGIVVAALLSVLGVPEQWITEEYLLSDGEVQAAWIGQALGGSATLRTTFPASTWTACELPSPAPIEHTHFPLQKSGCAFENLSSVGGALAEADVH